MAAASLVEDGDTIFIDASTTTQTMAQYLIGRQNLTVITNNMALATYLSECEVSVICLGGNVLANEDLLGFIVRQDLAVLADILRRQVHHVRTQRLEALDV